MSDKLWERELGFSAPWHGIKEKELSVEETLKKFGLNWPVVGRTMTPHEVIDLLRSVRDFLDTLRENGHLDRNSEELGKITVLRDGCEGAIEAIKANLGVSNEY